jgi:hypothetical protein
VSIHASHDEDILKAKIGAMVESTPPQLHKQIWVGLQSGAFQSLCQHLRERSDEIQNIDLMTLAGFCRNCLAKVRWFLPKLSCKD